MSKHVVVVGGGIVGLSAAWHCVRRGHRVTVIDRGDSQRTGCSFGNAGMIVPSHVVPLAAPGMIRLGLKWMWDPKSPFYIRPRASWDLLQWLWQFRQHCTKQHVLQCGTVLRDLHLRSRECYLQMQSDLPGGFDLKQHGLLMLCKTKAGLHEEAVTATAADALGVPAEVLTADGTARLDSGIKTDVLGSVYYPRDCHLDPNRLMSAIETDLIARGCHFIWNAEVTGAEVSGSQIRRIRYSPASQADDASESEFVDADEVVLCGGVWSSPLARQLGLRLPMQAGKGFSVMAESPAELPAICSLLSEARVAVTPIGTSLRVGGTMEVVGIDASLSPLRIRGIVEAIPKYYPNIKSSDFELSVDQSGAHNNANNSAPQYRSPWVGLRPCSPDGMPYIGRTARYDNLVVATGHAMMGISLAPATGEIVADLIGQSGSESTLAPQLSPDRYL